MAVAELLTVAGAHVPVIPCVEVVSKTGATEPLHIGVIAVKAGTMPPDVTVTVNVVVVAHWPGSGVKV